MLNVNLYHMQIYCLCLVTWQIRLKQQALMDSENAMSGSAGGGTIGQDTSPKLRPKNSFKVKGIFNKLLKKDRKTKSCENLHVL